jgi:hypothetical protein
MAIIDNPSNWHEALANARADHINACYWIGFIKGQATANGKEPAVVDACQRYLDVYGYAECEAEALDEIDALIADPENDDCDRWADEADYRYDLMRDEQMLSAWENAA